MAVYVGDRMHGALMIKKVGSQWHVFRLKEVQFKYASYDTTFGHKYKNVKFVWENTPYAKHGYKPYDDDDVTGNPGILIDEIKRFAQHKMRQMI